FNMIFLPKFSALKRGNDPQLIRDHCRVVVDFIFTFLPFCGVFIFGLLHFAVRAWFPPSYLAAVDSIAVTVLFSAFYLAYALVRGILDGLFEFPYTNIICFSGFSIIALTALVFGSTTFTISIAFGCGLFTLGIVSVGTLVRKLQLSIRWLSLSKSLALATLVFFLLYYADGQLTGSGMRGFQSFAVSLSYRVLLLGALWGLYWRKTLWYNEVLKRLRVPKTVND
ncbi:MAG: hypothetical protein GY940_09170, partial [bacterium]|nr:hypothetical protein [bacterium]